MKTVIAKGLMLLGIATVACNTRDAMAQTGYHHHHGHHGHGWTVGSGYGFGGYGYGPGTVAESYYRGYADLVRAAGESNYYNAMAQVQWEQAREKSIINRTAKVEQFFALRKFNEEQRLAAIAKSRLSKQQLVALSKKAAPQRLGDESWNPTTDGLAWPPTLERSNFASARTRLDELFRLRRSSSRGLVGDELAEAQQLADEMIDGLKDMISDVKPTDYTVAKRFLTSLAYEAKLNPATGERIAQK